MPASWSYHVEPIIYGPPVHAYGHFSEAFMRQVLQVLATAIKAKQLELVGRPEFGRYGGR